MKVSKSTSGVLSSGGAVVASDLTVDGTTITVNESANFVGIGTSDPGAKLEIQDTTTSSASTGGSLRLSANDGAPMGDSHRLGVIEFTGAEDSSNTQVIGAKIEALTDAAWTNVENGCALYFWTTDGNQSQTNVLKIDSNAKSTFSGNVQVNGDIDLTGGFSFDGGTAVTSIDTDLSSVSGSDDTLASAKAIGAQLDTKSPTTGHSSIATVGTITTGVWQGTAIANAYVADLPTSKVTSGTFADGRISSSSVVQHQGAITGSGALNSGTITSGFGAIDNGASGYTTTGAATVGTVLATQDNNGESLPIVAKNADDTDAANAAVGYGFDLETTAGATVNSAKIVAKKKESFTATASTQDAKLEFYVTKNGSEAKQFTLQGGNEFRFSNSDSSITVGDSSGTDQNGKNITIEAGAGTGSGVPGKFELKTTAPLGSGSTIQSHNLAITADANGVSIHTGASLSGLANDTGFGEIVYWGTEDSTDTLAAGRLMYMATDSKWKYADADAVATTNTLLAIALGTAVSDGLLIKGYFKLNSYIEGSFAAGAPCYVSEASGEVDFTAPSAAGDVVRIIGHGTSETNVILFDPSNDYVEL